MFDDRRNTSRVILPPPDALPNALRALTALKRDDPGLVAWITAGAPNLSTDEHIARFGVPHPGKTRSRR